MASRMDIEEYIDQLEKRNGEMAFLLGMFHVGLVELLNTEGMGAIARCKLIALNDIFNDKIVALFYKDENDGLKQKAV